ncbi:MAG: LysR family transcriptional regulator [Proteobacteria bacterium]|nr:LysR family transcriptional regulator [Pseudomonadota bacterium]
MNLDTKQLVVFVTVAEQQSFSRAAKALGMAQASVSERIASLERSVGTRLLDRFGRRTELTEAGKLLIRRAREILALQDTTAAELQAFLGLSGGEVKLGGSTAPGEYRIPRLLGAFALEHPDISVCLEIGDSDRIIDGIESGAFDLGVVGRQVTGEAIVSKKTWSDSLVLAVRPDHPFARRRKPISGEELVGESWIMREVGSATRFLAEKFLKKALPGGIKSLRVATELGSVGAIKEGLKAGLGIALMSETTIATDLEDKRLKTAPVEGLSIKRSFYLIRNKHRTLSPAAAALWKHIAASV